MEKRTMQLTLMVVMLMVPQLQGRADKWQSGGYPRSASLYDEDRDALYMELENTDDMRKINKLPKMWPIYEGLEEQRAVDSERYSKKNKWSHGNIKIWG